MLWGGEIRQGQIICRGRFIEEEWELEGMRIQYVVYPPPFFLCSGGEKCQKMGCGGNMPLQPLFSLARGISSANCQLSQSVAD